MEMWPYPSGMIQVLINNHMAAQTSVYVWGLCHYVADRQADGRAKETIKLIFRLYVIWNKTQSINLPCVVSNITFSKRLPRHTVLPA